MEKRVDALTPAHLLHLLHPGPFQLVAGALSENKNQLVLSVREVPVTEGVKYDAWWVAEHRSGFQERCVSYPFRTCQHIKYKNTVYCPYSAF